jgi:hypothetical protein
VVPDVVEPRLCAAARADILEYLGLARPALAHGLFDAWGLARACLPPPSTYLGSAIGAGLCARRHRLPRLWRTAAPHCRADPPRLSPSRSTRRRAPDRAATAYPPREPHPSKGGTSPHNLRLDTTSLAVPPRRIAAPSKSVDPRPISPYNKPLRPSGPAEPQAPRRRAKTRTPPGQRAHRYSEALHPHPHHLT